MIRGGNKLNGRVKISGSKNAALAILPAVLLASEKVALSNIPDITDVRTMLRFLEDLGLTIRRRGRNALEFYPSRLRGFTPVSYTHLLNGSSSTRQIYATRSARTIPTLTCSGKSYPKC